MEGIGSRLGRASSRYGSAPVFTGPVRRWQKQWVQVPSSSSSSSVSYNHSSSFNTNGHGNNNNNNNNNVPAIRLRRWTPVPSDHPGGDEAGEPEERPRRKLRYTPIVVLEEKKKGAEKADLTAKPSKSKSLENDDSKMPSIYDNFIGDAKASDKNEAAIKDLNSSMDLELALKGHDDDHADSSNKQADWIKAARTGFAR